MGSTITERTLRTLANACKGSKQVWDDDREARDSAIADADAAGWGLREIARATDMSVSHVQRIVGEQTARRQGPAVEMETAPQRREVVI